MSADTTYTGVVEPGDDPDVRGLGGLGTAAL